MSKKNLTKIATLGPLFKLFIIPTIFLSYFNLGLPQKVLAGLEFQWDNNGHKKLKWYQINGTKRARNKIFLFLKPNDRKTGLVKISIKVPNKFKSSLKEEKISLCKVNIGGFQSRTKCLENTLSDIELNDDKTNIDIYPIKPLPSSKDAYAVVFKINNPQRTGLYQFHSFGQSSGKVPVSYYLGSWTLQIEQP